MSDNKPPPPRTPDPAPVLAAEAIAAAAAPKNDALERALTWHKLGKWNSPRADSVKHVDAILAELERMTKDRDTWRAAAESTLAMIDRANANLTAQLKSPSIQQQGESAL